MAEEVGTSGESGNPRKLDLLLDVPLDLSVELGRARMSIQDLLNLSPGSVIELDKIAGEHKDATFIFGHAKAGLPVTGTRADLLNFRDYLSAVVDLAHKGIKAGKSRDEIIKADALAGFEDYAATPPRLSLGASLGVAYDELTAK